MGSYRLLLFDAPWNGTRQDISDLPNGLIPERIDTDIQQDLAFSFQIINVPTLILLRDGLECWRQVGRRPVSELRRTLFTLTTSEPINPAWLTWNDGLIPKLAKVISQEEQFADLPILADALEEAGCTNADILNHCRQLGKHVARFPLVRKIVSVADLIHYRQPRERTGGCWVVDLILDKS
jgi:hypothetical protein